MRIAGEGSNEVDVFNSKSTNRVQSVISSSSLQITVQCSALRVLWASL